MLKVRAMPVERQAGTDRGTGRRLPIVPLPLGIYAQLDDRQSWSNCEKFLFVLFERLSQLWLLYLSISILLAVNMLFS